MKKILLLSFLLNIFSIAQVKFQEITFDKAQILAKNDNKKIMVDFYTDWCAPCKDLDKYIFGDSTIGKYINKHYISLRIDAESDYGRKIGNKLSLQEAYPTVLFLAFNGEEIDRIVGLLLNKNDYFQTIKDYTINVNTLDELISKEKDGNVDLILKKQIAQKYFERGKFEDAIKYYGSLTDSEKFNSDGIIYFTLGKLYSFINNIKKAKEFTEKAISKNPSQSNYKEFLEKLNNK